MNVARRKSAIAFEHHVSPWRGFGGAGKPERKLLNFAQSPGKRGNRRSGFHFKSLFGTRIPTNYLRMRRFPEKEGKGSRC